MRDGGKGDKRRPLTIPEEQFNNNWDAIFKKQKEFGEAAAKAWSEVTKTEPDDKETK